MGTWCSATPRGQFGVQEGGMIFTSSRPVSPSHWLGGTGFRGRDRPVPGTQLSWAALEISQGRLWLQKPALSQSQRPPPPRLSQTSFYPLTPAQHKSQWALASTSLAPLLT